MDTLHKILNLLWKSGVSEIEFCKALGINKSAVTDWKKGKTASYRKYITQISSFFDVSPDYFNADNPTSDEDIKFALFGTTQIDDEVLDEVKRFAKYIKDKKDNGDKEDI